MNPLFNTRNIWFLGIAALMSGCATKPLIDPASLPPEASMDDGIDYYSASLGEEKILDAGNDQWTTDEEGNRVYLLNQIRRGSSTIYYVGDIQYVFANENRNGARTGSSLNDTPTYVSRGGAPLHSPTFRGSYDNTYYQTRRGRITYLPSPRVRPPANSTQGNNPGSSGSTSGSNSQPTAAPPRAPRRTAPPPTSKPQRQVKPNNDTRRRDR